MHTTMGSRLTQGICYCTETVPSLAVAGKKFSAGSPLSMGVAETCGLVPGATGVV